jgi:hypothetical protein
MKPGTATELGRGQSYESLDYQVLVNYSDRMVASCLVQAGESSSATQSYSFDVVAYEVDASSGGQRVSCTLDNRNGTLSAPVKLASLKIERGLRLSSGDYYAPLPTFYVTKFRFEQRDHFIALEGCDGLGLLDIWTATDSWLWEADGVRSYEQVAADLFTFARLAVETHNDAWGNC